MKFSEYEEIVQFLQETVFLPFSKNIADFTSQNYQLNLKDGLPSDQAMLLAVSNASSKSFRDSIAQSLFILLNLLPDSEITKDDLKTKLKVIRPND